MADSKKISDCICRLVCYNGSLQIAHWKADTVTNEHKALGELYESMTGLTDDFAEIYLGKYGMVTFPPDCTISDISDAPCEKGLKEVTDLQSYFKAGKDDDLLNTLADMSSALNKAKYLLKEGNGEMEDEEEEKPPKPALIIAIKRKLTK